MGKERELKKRKEGREGKGTIGDRMRWKQYDDWYETI
jgi:hypothetical protein